MSRTLRLQVSSGFARLSGKTDAILRTSTFLFLIASTIGCSTFGPSGLSGPSNRSAESGKNGSKDAANPPIASANLDVTTFTTADEMQNYLNTQIKWSKGETVVYDGLNSCEPVLNYHRVQNDPQKVLQLRDEYARAEQTYQQVDEKHTAYLAMPGTIDGITPRTYDPTGQQLSAAVQQSKDYLEQVRRQLYEQENNNTSPVETRIGYECNDGFVTIDSPQGKRVCDLDNVRYDVVSNKVAHQYKTANCRWRS